MVDNLGLPVYAHLQDATGTDYALVIASPLALERAGVSYVILDKDARDASYAISLETRPDARREAARSFDVLYDDGQHVIVRASIDQADTLATSGLDINWLGDAMVLGSPRTLAVEALAIDPDPTVTAIIGQVQQNTLYDYVGDLSGEWAVSIGGSNYTISTRNTSSGTPIQKATQFAYEHFEDLGLSVSYHNWTSSYSGRNIVAVKPGATSPDEIVIVVAHLDDMPSSGSAPGADDNASGSAGVMIAADILSQYDFERTIRFLLVTGEEQGLLGSAAYANKVYNDGDNIVAVYNMDMIGYDGSGGPTLRIHTRTTGSSGYPGDRALADLFVDVVDAYGLSSSLTPIIDTDGETRSDHASFWNRGYSAILAIEDDNDFTPYYHTSNDKLSTLNMPYFTNYAKASLGTIAHLALPAGSVIPAPSNLVATDISPDQIDLTWTDNASDEDGCKVEQKAGSGTYAEIATVSCSAGYSDTSLTPGSYCYRVRAYKGSDYSAYSNEDCATVGMEVVFEDDFSTDKGWISAGGTATTGAWERGDPQPTSYSSVDYQIDAASPTYDLVTGALAGSGVGDYDIDGGDTRFRSPDVTLPGSGEITLSFNYYLAHYSNASSDDYLTVKVVGSTTETVLQVLGAGSIKGAAWQNAEVSLNVFAGQTVYLLVEAADAGSGSLVEAAIDDVVITGIVDQDPPIAPSNLVATAVSESQIDLTWTDNSTGEGGFEIQRKTGSGSFATIATVGANVTAYSDTGLTANTTYDYRVRATKGSLVSGWSNEDSATTLSPTPPADPSNLVATAASQTSINLTWTDNATDEDGFEVQRKTGSGSFATVATLGANVTAYTDTGLAPGTTYDYRARATKGSLTSGWSNEDSATTPAGPVFEDDFETDKGWTSAGGTATTGQFERANPESTSYSGVDYQLGDAASGSYDLVTGASAGSSVGSYDIDGGDTRFRSPDIPLPSQSGLTLSFSYYLAHYSNATSDDYLTVKVVGNTTQTVLDVRGSASIKGGAWQTASVNLDAFAGQTVYLLVEAADGGSGSLVEAAIDDVLIE
ncbi:MAG: M28 family peptidase [bacterium]|nr:M28 family peptidase [bacterium]